MKLNIKKFVKKLFGIKRKFSKKHGVSEFKRGELDRDCFEHMKKGIEFCEKCKGRR